MKRTAVWMVISAFLIGAAGFGVWRGYQSFMAGLVPERCYLQIDGDPLTLTHEQAGNAAIIVAASYRAGLPEQASVVALATAWQESGLRNLSYGDRDSIGLFQQRPSYGWGTEAEIMDPWYSSSKFYEELVKFTDWETTDVNDMAQKVQRSGFPEAYRKHEANAVALAGAFRGSRPATFACFDRSESEGNAAALDPLLSAVPGVEVSQEGNVVTLVSDDETALWSATQLALSATRDGGIESANLAEESWIQDSSAAWLSSGEPLEANTAQLTLRVLE